jgi:hypothetical protein
MGTNSSLPILAPLGAPSSSQIHTTLSIDGIADVNGFSRGLTAHGEAP